MTIVLVSDSAANLLVCLFACLLVSFSPPRGLAFALAKVDSRCDGALVIGFGISRRGFYLSRNDMSYSPDSMRIHVLFHIVDAALAGGKAATVLNYTACACLLRNSRSIALSEKLHNPRLHFMIQLFHDCGHSVFHFFLGMFPSVANTVATNSADPPTVHHEI
jgi:hypothetical protein